jgi:hypothetical protein
VYETGFAFGINSCLLHGPVELEALMGQMHEFAANDESEPPFGPE